MNPKISIFTSSYNHSKYLKEAIDSVINQTYDNFEYFLIDDGSDDNTYEIMSRYSGDSRVKIIKLLKQPNVGVVINKSIKLSTGDYWSWCPADDYWSPNLLETKVNYIKKYPKSVLYNNWFIVNDGSITKHADVMKMSSDEFKNIVWQTSPIGFTGILIPMYVFRDLNVYFPEHLLFSEDFYWMIEATINNVPFNCVPERLHYKRRHSNSLTSKNIEKIIKQIPIIRNELKLKYGLK
jgi:teichuronic acid biosynthesis glycosyltransferase TuaG